MARKIPALKHSPGIFLRLNGILGYALKASVPLIKENLRNNWAIAAFGLLGYFFTAVFPVITIDDVDGVYYWMRDLLQFCNVAMILLNVLIPLLSAIMSLRYLQAPGSVSVMHSLPLTRPMLLMSQFLSGLAICWLPLIITCAASILAKKPAFVSHATIDIESWSKVVSSGYIITQYALMLLQTALAYSIFILAGIAASNTPMHIISCFAFAGLPSALGLLANVFCSRFLFGYFETERVINFISIPAVPIYFSFEVGNPPFPVVIGYIVATFALLACAMALYDKRPLEKAGDSVAFGFMEVGICIFFSLMGATLFAFLLESIYVVNDAYFFVGMAAGGFASFFAARMIVKKTTRVWNKESFLQFGVYAAIAFLLVTGLKTDAFGFERRVPKANEVESVNIELEYILGSSIANFTNRPYVFKNKDAVSAVISMHERIVANRGLQRQARTQNNVLSVTYDMANGRQLSRRWLATLRFHTDDAGLAALLETDEFKAQNRFDENLAVRDLTFLSASTLDSCTVQKSEHAKFIAALNADLDAQTSAQMVNESIPQFWAQVLIDNQFARVGVSSNFQNTINLLKEQGYYDGLVQWKSNIKKISIQKGTDQYDILATFTDPDQIREAIDNSEPFIKDPEDYYFLNIEDGSNSGGYTMFVFNPGNKYIEKLAGDKSASQ
jgi:hypothetical protein